jgi:hypothetical protein
MTNLEDVLQIRRERYNELELEITELEQRLKQLYRESSEQLVAIHQLVNSNE